jgi:hypothetical protein
MLPQVGDVIYIAAGWIIFIDCDVLPHKHLSPVFTASGWRRDLHRRRLDHIH